MSSRVNCIRVGLVVALLATGCSTFLPARNETPPPIPIERLEIDEQVTELYAMMRHDWAIAERHLSEIPVDPAADRVEEPVAPGQTPARLHLTSASVLTSMYIPVVGITPAQLIDSFGAPRDGGRRRHRGIDIKAPRGTKVVAVADGEISYVGTQSKAGRSVWLVTDSGVSFFYAHLDRWASGIREGQKVRKGTTIGYVGNTGNARHSGPHLHFAIHRHSQAINPYPHLVDASMAERARPVLAGGLAAGSQ